MCDSMNHTSQEEVDKTRLLNCIKCGTESDTTASAFAVNRKLSDDITVCTLVLVCPTCMADLFAGFMADGGAL